MSSRTFDVALSKTEGNGPYRLLRGVHDALVRRFEGALDAPEQAQRERLLAILRAARGTAFGKEHDLDDVRSLEDLRRAVPVRTHEQLRPWLERVALAEPGVLVRERVLQLLETSGTTGRPKHLPVTPGWARSVGEAQKLWVLAMVRDHEAAAQGKALTVVSSAAHARSSGGLAIGSNTGRMHRAQPWWLRLRYPVPYAAFCIADQELRQYAVLRFALQARVTSITTANPSTVLLLARRLVEWRDPLARDLSEGTIRHGPAARLDKKARAGFEWRLRRRPVPGDWTPARLWPLALVNCWKGGPASYFVDRLADALGADLPVREVGITSSEGYFAVPLGDDWDGGVLWTLGHVLEFVDDGGSARWAWELEAGRRYRLVITTEAGLYRYDLEDLVEVVGFCRRTPVVRFVGKAGRYLNAVGERVTEAQVSEAMRRAAAATGSAPVGFTAHVAMAEIPVYEVAMEGARDPQRLALAFDEALQAVNPEYAGKKGSGRLAGVRAVVVPEGTYARYRAGRVDAGAPDGQVKDPVTAVAADEWARIAGER